MSTLDEDIQAASDRVAALHEERTARDTAERERLARIDKEVTLSNLLGEEKRLEAELVLPALVPEPVELPVVVPEPVELPVPELPLDRFAKARPVPPPSPVADAPAEVN